MKIQICRALLTCLLLLASALGAQQPTLSGRVFDAGSGLGISSLTVKLEPPKAEGDRQIVTYTDADGRFKLPGLSSGKYLLTVSQGPTLLHREVVEINGNTTRDIPLRRG